MRSHPWSRPWLRAWPVAAAWVVAAAPVRAQLRADTLRADVRRLAGDIWRIETAPVRAAPRDLAAAAATSLAVGTLALGDRPVYAWMQTHPRTLPMLLLRPLREEWRFPLYELGSGQSLLPLSGVLYLSGLAAGSRQLREAGLGCATAHLTSALARDVVYRAVQRDRPRVSPDDASRWRVPGARDWDRHSFFSGHIANSMGCASFFSHHGDLGPVAPATYVFVSAIGIGRVADGRHWPSDAMVGALFGYAVGKAVADGMRARSAHGRAGGVTPLAFRWSMAF